ncbi:cysteine--tRNA ligase [Pseudemcibacter aquimaris]|uniref:cysteine--tRNA ligase n=1 Tax=Pseudemcibacter aquimaris TaxID=2857064 RepID=UPI0020123288|nr:cysteine--tRNA ligase [Pseudemcibacter aquimaris]MCC3859652.1 cysteine--tRNA ligase [Pseudemcibacter aquimaris]WDU60047.1 cysteine--tRNA ligase [Pseudemcibacter aquimaris]
MANKLKIYNTLNNVKEEFNPIDPNHVKMYVCGPTVYNYAHVGNARPVVVFDTLYRLLKHDYPNVTYARNITDIDDKIIEASLETGDEISTITEKYTRIYEEDMGALNAFLPDIRPKATEYIQEMIDLISDLIKKGHAYEVDGHVLFEVSTMADYGELSGKDVNDLIAGARVNVADYKREGADFVLWKPSTDEQPGWESPWGRGRPGWHTECSAMIHKNFGETIDIHGGGQDLIFPHHENEIAQSKCSHGGANLANYWMHNGYLTVDGEKMSKSLGNFITVHELLEEFPGKGEAVRMALLTSHYRQPADFSRDAINQAKKQLDRWYRAVEGVKATEPAEAVLEAMRDDLNTPKAIMELNQLAKDESNAGALKASAALLGLLQNDDWFAAQDVDFDIDALIQERADAKANKNWARADEIRDELAAEGITLLDGPEGTTWEKN